MRKFFSAAVAMAVLTSVATSYGQSAVGLGIDSDRIQDSGAAGTADLYGTGNDDTFGSYGIVTFNFTAADFGLSSVTDLTSSELQLTFNDRFFSDGADFNVYFTTDDFDATYTGLTYDDTGTNDPDGIITTQFTNLTSLGNYALGFDATDGGTNGGEDFTYALNLGAAESDLIAEINAGSDFSLIIAANDNADDITFSGVGNTFDPGDPQLTLTTTAAIPEPSSLVALGLVAMAGGLRRRRS